MKITDEIAMLKNTHLMEWLKQGYGHCHHGSKDWCEGYFNSAHDYIIALEAAVADAPALVPTEGTTMTELTTTISQGCLSLLKRMDLLLDDLSPDDTIGFSNGARWVDVATVEEIRRAAALLAPAPKPVQFLPYEDGEFNGNEQSEPEDENNLDKARKWLSARWCITHPNEAHVRMLAEYATALSNAKPAPEAVKDDEARAVGRGMIIAAAIIMSCWGDETHAREILEAGGFTTLADLNASGVHEYDINLVKSALRDPAALNAEGK